MGREQRQRDKAEKQRQKEQRASSPSLKDALSATQQHTVPVLPAYGPSSLAEQEKRDNTNGRPSSRASSTSYARATLAPQTTQTRITSAQTLAQVAQPTKPTKATETPATPPAKKPRSVRAKTTGAHPRLNDGEEYAEGDGSQSTAQLVMSDVIADAIPAGKATRVLPTMDTEEATQAATQLVPVRQQDRQLALPVEPTTPTIFIPGAKKPARFHSARVVPRRQGPRPFLVQFIVAMMTVMVLFTLFTLASPVGKTITSFGIVQAYANSVPWIPTPTPTPKPKPKPSQVYNPPPGANPGQQAIINMIVSVFGGYSQGALNVSRCESGYDPNARNPYAIGNSHAEGVFQILYPSTWDGTSYAGYSPYNYWANIHAAYQIFSRDGYSWREWACQP